MSKSNLSAALVAMRGVAIGVLAIGLLLLAAYAAIVFSSHVAPAYSLVRMLVGTFGTILTVMGVFGIAVVFVATATLPKE